MKKRKSPLVLFQTCICLCMCLWSTLSTQTPSLLQQYCPTRPTPQKFAILTTTYIRSNSTKMINDYLRRYAESQCDVYDNIYIVWNNEETPEEMGVLKNAKNWKKNVYFMQTVENSLDFKYIVPNWAKEKVVFGMDDDFDISCDTLKKAFSSWQQAAYGEVGPLASFYGRSYVFEAETQSFSYIDQIKLNKNWNYYHFGLTGIAFIPRHFLELYYSDIFQIKEMRKQVVQKNNCQDLLLNFLVGYLYPQLVTEYLDVPFKSLGNTGVSTTKKHKEYRAQCITRFTQILGYNPIRYTQSRKNLTLMQKKTSINENCLVNLKQENFEKNFIKNRAYYLYIKRITGVENDFIREENARLVQAKKDIERFMRRRREEGEKGSEGEEGMKVQLQEGLSEGERKMLEEKEMEMHFGSEEQVAQYQRKFGAISQQLPQQPQTQSKPSLTNQQPIQQPIQQLNQQQPTIKTQEKQFSTPHPLPPLAQTPSQPHNNDEYILYLIILSSIIISILCIKKVVDSRSRKYQTVPISVASQL